MDMAMGNSGINGKSHPAYRHQGPAPGRAPGLAIAGWRNLQGVQCRYSTSPVLPSAAGLLLLAASPLSLFLFVTATLVVLA